MLQVVNSYRESYPCMIPLRAFDSPANQLEARLFSDRAHNPYGCGGDEQPRGSISSRSVLSIELSMRQISLTVLPWLETSVDLVACITSRNPRTAFPLNCRSDWWRQRLIVQCTAECQHSDL